jgi:hypothetical protein
MNANPRDPINRWIAQNPDEARRAFSLGGYIASSQPGHVERILANRRKWEQEHPEESHRQAMIRGFKVAHFTRRCHDTKANPRCPFCYPDGEEVRG